MSTSAARFRKGIVAGLGTVAYALQAALGDGELTASEWGTIVGGVIVTGLVVALRNAPEPPPSKPPQQR